MIRMAVERGHKPGRGWHYFEAWGKSTGLNWQPGTEADEFVPARAGKRLIIKIFLTKCILNIVRFSYTWCVLYQP